MDRRQMMSGTLAGLAALSSSSVLALTGESSAPYRHADGPRSRVMVINDLSGDIDGLFSTVHALLSHSAQVRSIVATSTFHGEETAASAAKLAHEILELMDLKGQIPVFEGATSPMANPHVPVESAGARAIIAEAMRDDTELPLYICAGGGLTEVASAILMEPRIAERFTLVWIGGNAYPAGGEENNVLIDPASTQFIFNESTVKIWQVPSTAYSLCQISDAEIQAFIAPHGRIGAWLYDKIFEASERIKTYVVNKEAPWNTGETWTLGDNPLVLLTALTAWVPSNFVGRFKYERTDGSAFREIPAPKIDLRGNYTQRADGRLIRVYDSLDTRMMMSDLFAKMRSNFPAVGAKI